MLGSDACGIELDADLDGALAGLHTVLTPSAAQLARIHDRVLHAARGPAGLAAAPAPGPAARPPGPARRRRPAFPRPARLAVAACVLAAGLVGAGAVGLGGSTPAAGARAATVLRSAAAATTPDPVPAPGQYLLLTTRSWDLVEYSDPAGRPTRLYLAEHLRQVWAPGEGRSTWQLTTTDTGAVRWYLPTTPPADFVAHRAVETHTGLCGDFTDQGGCAAAGSWQDPTTAWVAALPRDPDRLLARLEADAPRNDRGDAEYLAYAADALRSGLLPADVRVALYTALTHLRGLVVTHDRLTLDGRTGTALGIDDGTTVQEIVIDAASGRFLGERDVASTSAGGLPRGTVLSSSSVTTGLTSSLTTTG